MNAVVGTYRFVIHSICISVVLKKRWLLDLAVRDVARRVEQEGGTAGGAGGQAPSSLHAAHGCVCAVR